MGRAGEKETEGAAGSTKKGHLTQHGGVRHFQRERMPTLSKSLRYEQKQARQKHKNQTQDATTLHRKS